MSDASERLAAFLSENGNAEAGASIGPDDDLLASGVLDSVGITQLVSFVEEEFGVEVGDDDLVAENFGSIGKILEFVESKHAVS
jgi:acyl carrier protein